MNLSYYLLLTIFDELFSQFADVITNHWHLGFLMNVHCPLISRLVHDHFQGFVLKNLKFVDVCFGNFDERWAGVGDDGSNCEFVNHQLIFDIKLRFSAYHGVEGSNSNICPMYDIVKVLFEGQLLFEHHTQIFAVALPLDVRVEDSDC